MKTDKRTILLSLLLLVLCLAATGNFPSAWRPGNNITFSTNGSIVTIAAAGSSGTPGGNSGAIQFNQGGSLAGTNDYVYDRTNRVLTLAGTSVDIPIRANGVGSSGATPFNLGYNTTTRFFVSGDILYPNADGVQALGIAGQEMKSVEGKRGLYGDLMVRTNGYFTNNIGFRVAQVTGVGGANTNFTLQAQKHQSVIYIDAGTTNVNLVAIMGGDAQFEWRGAVILTNRTATARLFSLGATTNNFISLQQFDGISAPFTVTNNQAARFEWAILGTNVQYAYKPMALPSN